MMHTPLDVDALRRARVGARIGHTIHYFDSVDSTNSVAQQLARDGATEGTVIIAEAQTKGRGRLGRAWVSPPFRNLYLSVIVRPPLKTTEAPPVTLVVGLASAEAVGEWTPRAALKWPNDVLIDGRKVVGILTEMDAEQDRVRSIVTGIGVNLNATTEDFPEELRAKAVSVASVIGVSVDRTAFATRLLARVEDRYHLFVREGFTAVRPLWERLSCLTGQQVRIADGDRRYAGRVTGITDDGSLCLYDDAGHEIHVVAGDVTVMDAYPSKAE